MQQEPNQPRRLHFRQRRQMEFGGGRYQPSTKRYIYFMMGMLVFTLWLIYYFNKMRTEDSAGRRLLDSIFSPQGLQNSAEDIRTGDENYTPVKIAP
tara:strand:- start:468 stop:755 length:288 start_codon:yes stop_codon:yes gene_type:complete